MELKHIAINDARDNNCDYVIISDCDEFIYHPHIKEFLWEHLNKTSVFYPAGFQMVTESFPKGEGQIYDLAKTGEPSPWYSKPILLNLNLVENLEWIPGCHEVILETLKISGDIYHVVPESVRPNAPYKTNKWGNWKIMFDLLHIFEKEPLKLLHYKFLGIDFVTERYNQYIDRTSSINKELEIMNHYQKSINNGSIPIEINKILNNSTNLKL
jgi:hypothetical protein